MNFFEKEFFGNPLAHWSAAVIVCLVTFLAGLGLKLFAERRFQRKPSHRGTGIHHLLSGILRSSRVPPMAVLAVYLGSQTLVLPAFVHQPIRLMAILGFFAQLGIWGNAAVNFFAYTNRSFQNGDSSKATTMEALGFLGKGLVWTTIGILVLDNFGIKVSTLIAGLGIGGVAVALAVQNVLGDLLASLSIILDKPFVIGDTIRVDKESGTVEHIGLKTTRLKSDSGEQLIFSNSDLLKSRIRNFKRMDERRVSFRLLLSPKNLLQKLENFPKLMEAAVRVQKTLRFERCFLVSVRATGLEFEVAYWVMSAHYSIHADALHVLNLEILKTCETNQIAFAHIHPMQLEMAGSLEV